MVDFIRAVNIHAQPRYLVELDLRDFVLLHQLRAFKRSGYRALDFFAAFAERFNKEVYGAARADADVFVFGHKFHRFGGGDLFELVLGEVAHFAHPLVGGTG